MADIHVNVVNLGPWWPAVVTAVANVVAASAALLAARRASFAAHSASAAAEKSNQAADSASAAAEKSTQAAESSERASQAVASAVSDAFEAALGASGPELVQRRSTTMAVEAFPQEVVDAVASALIEEVQVYADKSGLMVNSMGPVPLNLARQGLGNPSAWARTSFAAYGADLPRLTIGLRVASRDVSGNYAVQAWLGVATAIKGGRFPLIEYEWAHQWTADRDAQSDDQAREAARDLVEDLRQRLPEALTAFADALAAAGVTPTSES